MLGLVLVLIRWSELCPDRIRQRSFRTGMGNALEREWWRFRRSNHTPKRSGSKCAALQSFGHPIIRRSTQRGSGTLSGFKHCDGSLSVQGKQVRLIVYASPKKCQTRFRGKITINCDTRNCLSGMLSAAQSSYRTRTKDRASRTDR